METAAHLFLLAQITSHQCKIYSEQSLLKVSQTKSSETSESYFGPKSCSSGFFLILLISAFYMKKKLFRSNEKKTAPHNVVLLLLTSLICNHVLLGDGQAYMEWFRSGLFKLQSSTLSHSF